MTVIQIPGSITLDAHRLAVALLEELEPHLTEIKQAIAAGPSAEPLTVPDTLTVIHGHLPHYLKGNRLTASHLAEALNRAGYALVRLPDPPAPTRREKADAFFSRTD